MEFGGLVWAVLGGSGGERYREREREGEIEIHKGGRSIVVMISSQGGINMEAFWTERSAQAFMNLSHWRAFMWVCARAYDDCTTFEVKSMGACVALLLFAGRLIYRHDRFLRT